MDFQLLEMFHHLSGSLNFPLWFRFWFYRKIMDSGELDFYQHSRVCSNTCRSTKIDLVGTKVSLSGDQSDVVSAASSSADRESVSSSRVLTRSRVTTRVSETLRVLLWCLVFRAVRQAEAQD